MVQTTLLLWSAIYAMDVAVRNNVIINVLEHALLLVQV
jgi:hypothetical protein